MRRRDYPSRVAALLAMTALLSMSVAGCGDDDVISGDTFTITIDNDPNDPNRQVRQLAGGIICVPFTITGNANDAFAVLLEHRVHVDPPAQENPFLTASEITAATPGSSPPPTFTMLVSDSSGNLANGTFVGTFYWDAAADLGPFGPVSLDLRMSALEGGAGLAAQTNGVGGGSSFSLTITFTYVPTNPAPSPAPGSQTPGGTAGAAAGGAGRVAQNDFSPAGKNVVVAGGRNNAGMNNAFTSVDRFNIDPATLQYTSTTLQMSSGRTDHASSFFLDPATNALKLLVTGGVIDGSSTSSQATADVYCFTPTESVAATSNMMAEARRGHTATWAPNGKVYVIGGEVGAGTGAMTIESYDPATNLFSTVMGASPLLRRNHTASLLPNGRILIAGGYNPTTGQTTNPLAAELFDTVTETLVPFTSGVFSTLDFFDHTATRLANGWILLAGGRAVSNTSSVLSNATVFLPELGSAGDFTPTAAMMNSGRALHAAVLLGDGKVLVTGGETATNVSTTSAELFMPTLFAFSPVTALTTPRAEHSSTAVDNGTVVVLGGRNGATFFDSIEFYPQNNAAPSFVGASFGGSAGAGVARINTNCLDADGDGGYAILRWRATGMTDFKTGRLRSDPANPQTPIGVLPSGLGSIYWDFAASGLTSGAAVDVQLIPAGAVLGAPFTFTANLP